MPVEPSSRPLTTAEAAAVTLLAPCVALVLSAYLLDLVGFAFRPAPMLALAVLATAAIGTLTWRAATHAGEELALWLVTTVGLFVWLLWLAAPDFLPLSTGPDLTHHLLLIRHIETSWRLVHDPSLERFMGEMAQYTPGSHLLAALAGAWSGTDGLRALHGLQAWMVALKTGFLLLIAFRLLPPRAPRVLAMLGPVLLFGAPRYFLGGLTEYGFLAQVVAESFAVAMWWATVVWAVEPSRLPLLVFGAAGGAAFLTWPVYVGPPALAAFVVIALRTNEPIVHRVRAIVTAFVPIGVISLIYLIGRLGWLQMAGTGGAAPWPTVAAYGAPLVALAVAGGALSVVQQRGRACGLFLFAVLAQASAFHVLATRAGAAQPYMALKMGYLILWPMAACSVLAVGEGWAWLARFAPTLATGTRGRVVASVLMLVTLALVARPLAARPTLLHPLPPAVSLPVYEAGRWARAHVPPGCVEYLVGDDETAYWLHLAVLGNPRMSDRTGDNSTYEPVDAVVRWLTPNGLPYAIAELPALPRDVRNELDIIQQFGEAAVVRRRGASSCDPAR